VTKTLRALVAHALEQARRVHQSVKSSVTGAAVIAPVTLSGVASREASPFLSHPSRGRRNAQDVVPALMCASERNPRGAA